MEEIDRLNILQASLLAMQRAVEALPLAVDQALVDGNRLPELPCSAEAIVEGDGIEPCISAASILAKVSRDREMGNSTAATPAMDLPATRGILPRHTWRPCGPWALAKSIAGVSGR